MKPRRPREAWPPFPVSISERDKHSRRLAINPEENVGENSFSDHLLTAAFDIGTGYSGYAFAFNARPLQTHMNKNWTSVKATQK